MNSGQCIFCRIVKGEIPAEKVYEDDHALAFLDILPRSPGHVMVIPKTHAKTFLDLPENLIGPFFLAAQKVLGMLKKALAPDGFTLGINHGKVSGQEVDHLHLHIMPRWRGDGGHPLQSVISNPPSEELRIIADRIRGAQ